MSSSDHTRNEQKKKCEIKKKKKLDRVNDKPKQEEKNQRKILFEN